MSDAATPAVPEEPPADGAGRFGAAWPMLVSFARLLQDQGELRGLIGPRELPRLWSRHLLNSTAVNQYIPDAATVVDVGTGAGFPGVVTAITRPDATVHLVEPMQRRVRWLEDVAAELGLTNMKVHRARAEELHGELVGDVVTSRAVAALDKLLRWTFPLVRPGGVLVALKGRRAQEEVEAARGTLRRLSAGSVVCHEVEVGGREPEATVVVVRRLATS